VLLREGGMVLDQLYSVTGARAGPAAEAGGTALCLVGSAAQVGAARAMVQALLMAAGVAPLAAGQGVSEEGCGSGGAGRGGGGAVVHV
jgi:hypothetical protein